jgi:hypothetical protein
VPNEYLADELITAAKEEGVFPGSAEASFTPRIRRLLNREQRLYLMTVLKSVREEYQEQTQNIPLVSGVQTYRLPTRAVAAGIKLVERQVGGDYVVLEPINQHDAAVYGGDGYGTGDFVLEGNNLRLLPSVTAAGSLRITYYRRFSTLVPAEEAGEVESIDTSTGEVTLLSAPAGFLPSPYPSSQYDFIRGTPHFDVMAMDLTAPLSGLVLAFAPAELPSALAAGDFVALAGQTPICNAPLEMQDLLVKRAVYVYLLGQKDPGAQAAKASLDEAEQQAKALLSPRVEASEGLLINRNGPGWNRWGRRRRFSG